MNRTVRLRPVSARRSTVGRGYEPDLSLVASALAARFVQLSPDSETALFIDAAKARPHSPAQTWLHRKLRGLLSDYDVNGVLRMYPMHLLSTHQWEALLGDRSRQTLLDVGAGDGGLTRHLAPLFATTTTTECSWAMAKRLRRAGYVCLQEDIGQRAHAQTYDCVACLNVLDRTAYPLRLLAAMDALLTTGGALILATPLPLDPFYYRGPRTKAPVQRLHAPGPSWEQAATQFVRAIHGLLPQQRLQAWTRAPYLSWGDSDCSLYELDDFVGIWVKDS